MTALVDICICTFQRPAIQETLASLAEDIAVSNIACRIIVADNDDTPRAENEIRRAGQQLGLELEYCHCPARNISVARNGALDCAAADWVAFIDDDETVEPGWLSAMMERARTSGADIVLGPVVPVYGPNAPIWIRQGNFHATRPVYVNGRIETGYSCNVLFQRNVQSTAGQRFLVSLGRCGGEDTEFFDRLVRRGARIDFAPTAIVYERVPPERERFGWLLKRRYRFGQTHGALIAARSGYGGKRLRAIALASAKSAYSCGGAVLSLGRPTRRAFWALRAALHAGVVSRLIGHREISLYGGPSDD